MVSLLKFLQLPSNLIRRIVSRIDRCSKSNRERDTILSISMLITTRYSFPSPLGPREWKCQTIARLPVNSPRRDRSIPSTETEIFTRNRPLPWTDRIERHGGPLKGTDLPSAHFAKRISSRTFRVRLGTLSRIRFSMEKIDIRDGLC